MYYICSSIYYGILRVVYMCMNILWYITGNIYYVIYHIVYNMLYNI